MKNRILESVTLTDIADKGKSMGRVDNKAVFVEGAVPGDVADVKVFKSSKSFDEGRAVKIVTPSPYRTDSFCEHFGLCGGCKWQNLEYKWQLHFKHKIVKDAMERIAGIKDPVIEEIAGCSDIRSYRNKMEYTFTDLRYLLNEEMNSEEEKQLNGLGFHIPGKFNKVLHISECHLQDDRANQIRNFVYDYALQNSLTFFNLKTQHGLLRNLIIRNTSTDEWMVIVVFKEDDKTARENLLNSISDNFPFLNSIQYIINQKRNDSLHDQEPVLYKGSPHITEQLENLKFIISPKSFFQTNSKQAYELYKITREFASLTGDENVYDLYTGTGSIAAFISAKAKKVTGVEYISDAVEDAGINAKNNGLTNLRFYSGDMKDIITRDFFEQNGKPDVIITDPPRAGMHESVVNRILESGAKRIVYVSCNPATQARDIKLLMERYRPVRFRPVDMFPHTSHVENVALLELI